MSFDYQTLKNINAANAVQSGAITNAVISSSQVTNTVLASNAVTSSTLQSGSVGLNSSTITGTLPVSNGGTNLTSNADYNSLLRTNSAGSAMEYGNYGLYGLQVFTSSGTWNCPANVRYIRVQVQGGGGGGGGHGESGGAGGYSERILYTPSISSSVSVTCGGDSSGSFYSGAGSNGSSSSFGPYLSCGAGYGANQQNQHSAGVAGSGSGGDVNLYGGGGGSHHHSFGPGGRTYFGGSVAGGHPNGGNFSHNHQSHSVPGSGGRGAYFSGHYGSSGKGGMVIITHYY
jgi:hypothetical protein